MKEDVLELRLTQSTGQSVLVTSRGIYDRFNHRVALTHPADENNPYLPLDEDGNVKGRTH